MRPPRYAINYARLAAQHAAQQSAQQSAQQAAPVPPLAVCCREHPEWLLAVMAEIGLAPTPLTEALATYAAHAAQAVPPTAPGSAGGAGGAGARMSAKLDAGALPGTAAHARTGRARLHGPCAAAPAAQRTRLRSTACWA